MQLCKASGIRFKLYDEQMIVFDPNNGQTHCLDACANEIFEQLHEHKSMLLSQLIDSFSNDLPIDEKSMITDYITGMIDDLLTLDLVIEH